uniref:Ribonuclease H-like domain-containing protein n=1 Tax=Tanacetum cinerariifolium TaxID=118510 RepID=A0A6L2LUJ1_TANCI|nr:ribonuclease H-like domain-containing protein [Tanacetum cinerariifolium]
MRIELYFLMTDYSLWEVILNGDSPIPTKVINGVVQPVAPTTDEQRLARKNEFKARGTLLTALPDKHQLNFNIYKDDKSLMDAIENRFGRNKEAKKVQKTLLKQQYENFTGSISALPNVDNLSDAIIYSFFASQSNSPQLDNDDLKQIDANDLEEMDLKCYDWSFQADEEPTNYALVAFTLSSSSYDNENENVFEEDIKLLKLDVMLRDNALVDLRKKFEKVKQERDELKLKLENFQTSSKNLNVSMPTSLVHDRYKSGEGCHAIPPPYTGTFMPPKPDLVFHDAYTINETVPIVLNAKPSSTKPNKDLSQSNRPFAPIIEDWVSDSKDKSEGEPMPTQKAPSFVHTFEHVKPPRPSVKPVEHHIPAVNLRNNILKSKGHKHSWNKKACFVCKSLTHLIKDCDYYEKKMVQKPVRNHAMRGNHQHYTRMTHPHPHRHVVPTIVLKRSRLVLLTTARPVTTVVPQIKVQHQRPTKHGIQVSYGLGPQKTLTFLFNVQGNPQQAIKDKGVIDSGCSRHMTGNISYLSNFEEINRGYVSFGGNPKGGKITGKGNIRTGKLDFDDVYFVKELKFNLFSVSQMCDKKNNVLFTDTKCIVLSSNFKLPDENHVLFRVPGENNMYNVDLKNIVPSGDLTWLFAKATLDKSNLWYRRLGHINFKTMNKLVKVYELSIVVAWNQPNSSAGFQEHFDACKAKEGNIQQYVLFPLLSTGSKDPQNIDADATFKVKEPDSEVYVSLSSSANTKKHDDKTKREAKGQSPIKLSTGVRNLSEEFEIFSSNSTNGVNDASTPVTVVGPTLGKSSYVDPAQYPDDPDMLALEDIAYSDDEEDVGAEADFSNLEANIIFSPIPTTRVHKNHPVTQIISNLSLAPQTRSMTRMVKEQGGLTQIRFEDPDYPDKIYKVFKAIYGLHQAPRACQDKYVAEILRKFRLTDEKSTSTPIDTEKPLLKDPDGEDVDVHIYSSMIGLLMYPTLSRPAIMFVVCACARFQVTLKALDLYAVKRFLDASEAFEQIIDFLNTSVIQYALMENPTIYISCIKQFWSSVSLKKTNDVVRLQALIDRRKVIITDGTVRQAL